MITGTIVHGTQAEFFVDSPTVDPPGLLALRVSSGGHVCDWLWPDLLAMSPTSNNTDPKHESDRKPLSVDQPTKSGSGWL